MASSEEFVQKSPDETGGQRRIFRQAHEVSHEMAASIALRHTKRRLTHTALFVVAVLTSITTGAGVVRAAELCWKVLYG